MRRSRSGWGRAVGPALLLALFSAAQAPAEALSTAGLSRQVLANGLELFIYENHTVPLAKVQIVFRCGSIAQTPQTAGLFHLYEHMLFKGNAVYRSESDFQSAMKALGVASWNGGTSNELVAYYFTIPSEKVGDGIAFWANAIRYPLFDPQELDTEKRVVINEIRGYLNDPDDIFGAAMDSRLYAEYPWRRDVPGSEENIARATVGQMRTIQQRYYIPNNAALFVGGDVDPGRVREFADRSFGSWQAGPSPAADISPHPAPAADRFFSFADEQMYPGVARVTIRFRGPDVTRDNDATYAADVWGKLLDDPNGRFRTELIKRVPAIYNRDYIWGFYYTQRDGGFIEFTTYLRVGPGSNVYEGARGLLAAVRREVDAMASDASYFPRADLDLLKTKLADERLIEQETTNRLISSLSFWWASATTDYYLTYDDRLRAVDQGDLSRFVTDYLVGAKAVVGVRLNPSNSVPAEAASTGFELVDRSNAFWWSKRPRESLK